MSDTSHRKNIYVCSLYRPISESEESRKKELEPNTQSDEGGKPYFRRHGAEIAATKNSTWTRRWQRCTIICSIPSVSAPACLRKR